MLVDGHRDLPTGAHSCVIGGDHGERSQTLRLSSNDGMPGRAFPLNRCASRSSE
jgi:hypothetical protein